MLDEITLYFKKLNLELGIFEELNQNGFYRLIRPQIVYLYATIDALAYATFRQDFKTNKKRFIEFCEEFVKIEGISAEDIYDNRSSVIHNLTFDNEYKVKQNKSYKRFNYIYGNKTKKDYYKFQLEKWLRNNPNCDLNNNIKNQKNLIKQVAKQKSGEGYLFLNIKDFSNSVKSAIVKLEKKSKEEKKLQSNLLKYLKSVFPPQI